MTNSSVTSVLAPSPPASLSRHRQKPNVEGVAAESIAGERPCSFVVYCGGHHRCHPCSDEIAFRSPTASLRWCDLRRTSPRSVEVTTLELGRVLRRASDVVVSVVIVGDLSSMLNGKCLPSFVIFCCLVVD